MRRRRLGAGQAAAVFSRVRPVDAPGPSTTVAQDLVGTDLVGRDIVARVVGDQAPRWSLLLFLSSGCEGCEELWRLADPGVPLPGDLVAEGVKVVAVTKTLEGGEARRLASLVATDAPVVVSAEAWSAYRVLGPPFFAVVGRHARRVQSEGLAWGRAQVLEHLRAAVAGQGSCEVPRLEPRPPRR